MPIVKRKTPEQRLDSATGGSWKALLAVPMLQALSNPRHTSYVDVSAEGISRMVAGMYDKNWMSKVSWNEKIFLYVSGMVARRAAVPGFLSDDIMTQLARHMNAQTTIDKIDVGDNHTGFAFRQSFVWDLPAFLKTYKTPGSFTLPSIDPLLTPKPKKRLSKHRR